MQQCMEILADKLLRSVAGYVQQRVIAEHCIPLGVQTTNALDNRVQDQLQFSLQQNVRTLYE
jgi:hypothetical protein